MKLLKQHESCTEWNKTKRNGVALRLVLHCYLKKKALRVYYTGRFFTIDCIKTYEDIVEKSAI